MASLGQLLVITENTDQFIEEACFDCFFLNQNKTMVSTVFSIGLGTHNSKKGAVHKRHQQFDGYQNCQWINTKLPTWQKIGKKC